MSIKDLGKNNPSLAAAALQSNASPEQVAKLNALLKFQNIHKNLSELPQNDAYAKFKSYKPETQQILSELYSPKYTQDDRGFLYNLARGTVNMVKSAVWYGGGSTKDIFNQVMNFSPEKVILNTAKTAGQYALTPLADEKNPVGGALSDLMRPATKLIKQPYQAQVLYENATDNNILEDWKTLGSIYGQAVTELLPGGEDIKPDYQGGGWKQYWAQAADPESVFDTTAIAKFEKDLDPSVASVAKLLASGKDLVGEFDTYKNNPEITSLVAKWTSGDEDASLAIADAFARYTKSKISPGRDVARDLISLLPYEAEKAIMGDSQWKQVFNTLSGPIDLGVTVGLDPLLLAGKANKAVLAMKYGMAKNGVTSTDFARVVEEQPKVAKYFDEAGKLVNAYKTAAPNQAALALSTLRSRFKELSPGLIDDMAKAGVKDAKSTIQFFQGQQDLTALTQGSAVMERTALYPRYTVVDFAANKIRNFANDVLNITNFRNTKIAGANEDLSTIMSQNPATWASKIGVEPAFAKTPEGATVRFFTQRDQRISARVDRFVRMMEIAPRQDRVIQVSDASSADQIFAIARVFMDKTSASRVRAYWMGADEGQRLNVYTGLLKSLSRSMGHEYSEVGRKLHSEIDTFSKELYSVSQNAVDLGEYTAKASLISAGNIDAPAGVRQVVQDAMRTTTAQGKAGRVNASIIAEMKQNELERKALGVAKKQLKAQAAAGADVTDKLDAVNQQLRILGARWAKLNGARQGVKGIIKPQKVADVQPTEFEIIRSLNPEISSMDAASQSLVKVNFLKRFAEFNRIGKDAIEGYSKETIAAIAKDLQSGNGFVSPLQLEYWVDESGNLLLSLTEGNHRLAAAIQAGLKDVPVKMVRGTADKAATYKSAGPAIVLPKSDGYLPGSLSPREALPKDALTKIKKVMEDLPPEELMLDKFNAAEINGTQRAIRVYQLETARALPDLGAWRAAAARAGVITKVTGGASNSIAAQAVTDVWSFLNLYPRLGIRTTTEEVGTHLFINGAEGLSLYIKGREMSRALRLNELPGTKNAILKRQEYLKEVEETNLGVMYNNLYKILKKNKTKEELIALADDPERLAEAVAASVLNNRFRPQFFDTAMGNRVADYAGDFARFGGKGVIDDILGSSYRAEMRLSDTEVKSRTLQQFGPSIALNPNITEALKFHKFKGEYTEIASTSEGFLINWLLELNNTVGKRNGQFGNIVLYNAHKPQSEVISKLVDYISTPEGAELAKRFAIFDEVGIQNFAERIYADATYALRDSAGRINNKLVNALRDAKGVENFTLDDLAKIDSKYGRPSSILGKELVPIESTDAPNVVRRLMDNGYGWIGKQIALMDREPITYGNYIMYREQFRGHQANVAKGLLESGASEELAASAAAMSAHDVALNLARNRTLAFVDNADVRTNLAFSLKTFGRYYRATEDFYRRAVRIAKFEPEAIVRLAIANQTFEDSGFIHTDDKGQKYFIYPGQDILHEMLNATLYKFLGITVQQPLPVAYGGYMKMLTPSLDPQSAAPRIGGPVSAVAIDLFERLPYVGDFIKSNEQAITGGFNPDQPLWRKILPAQVTRAMDVAFGGDANIDARFNAIIKSMRMLITVGHGPKEPADVDRFLHDSTIMATNQQVTKLILGTFAPASIQAFENATLPSELIRSGAFTWNTEFLKFAERHAGDPNAFSKALVEYATIYPSKLAFTVSSTDAGVQAGFQKTLEAADFIKKNPALFLDHKEGASFFLPINGTSDYQSYQYLKSNGFVSNKILKDYVYEIATANARKAYYSITDETNAAIAESNDPNYKRFLRQDLQTKQQGLKAAFPMLATALSGGDQNAKMNALNDLRNVILNGKAPDPKLAKTFYAMITAYDDYVKNSESLGSSTNDRNYKNFMQADLRDTLVTIAGKNPNAQAVYNTLLDPLIGE